MRPQYFKLVHDLARNNAIVAVRSAEPGTVVIVRDETRSLGLNDTFHGICRDIAAHHEASWWGGKRRTQDEWKALLVSGHAVALGEPAELVPGLGGELISLREATSAMSNKRMASLVDYSLAHCDQVGVTVLRDPRGTL